METEQNGMNNQPPISPPNTQNPVYTANTVNPQNPVYPQNPVNPQNPVYPQNPVNPQGEPVLKSPPAPNKTVEAMRVLKKVTGTWLMLVLAIACTVATIFNVVDMIPKLKGLLMVFNLVKLILAIVICVGVWKVYINGRSNNLNASGFKLIKNVITFRYVIIMILVAIIMLIIILAMSFASSVGGYIDTASNSGGTVSGKVNTVLIVILLVLGCAIAVLVLFFKSVIGSLGSASNLLENKIISKNNYYMAAIILLIIGVFKFASIFLSSALGALADTVLATIASSSESMSKIGSLGGLFDTNWSGIILNVCDMLNYVVGGIIIILYAKKIKVLEKQLEQQRIGNLNII